MPRAGHEVIVHHSGRLHQRIADCRACKLESMPQQVAAHRIGFPGPRRYLGHRSPTILDRLATNETPQISVEGSEFFAHGEKRLRILDRRRDLQPVAHNAFVTEKPFHIARAIPGDLFRAKSSERLPVILALLQNCNPAQPCLSAFEDQKFEQ